MKRGLSAVLASVAIVVGACGRDDPITGPVIPPTVDVASITVTPNLASIEVGDSLQYTAVVRDSNDQVLDIAVQWSSSDESVGVISDSGLFISSAEGSAVVTATDPTTTTFATSNVQVVPDGAIVISDRVVVVDSTTWVLLSDSTERAGGTYRFEIVGAGGLTRGPSDTTWVEVGDIVVGGQAFGFLREVASVSQNGDIVTLQTTQASLTDAVLKGDFLHAFPVNDPAGSSSGAIQVQPWVVTLAPPGTVQQAQVEGTIRLDGIAFQKKEICNSDGACFEVGFEVKEGTLRFRPDLDLGGELGGGKLKEFHIRASGVLNLDADIEFSAKLKVGGTLLDKTLLDPEKFFDKEVFQAFTTFQFVIGYLPVFGRIIFNVSLEAEASVGIEATWTSGVHIQYGIGAGLKWDGNRWSDDAPPVPKPSYTEDEFKFDGLKGVGEIQMSVVPELNLELYAVAGPFIEVEPYVKVAGEVDLLTADANAQLLIGTDVNLGFKTNDDVKDLTGIGLDYTALSIPLFRERKVIEIFTNKPLFVSVDANGDPDDLPENGFELTLGPSDPASVVTAWRNLFHLDVGCTTVGGAPGPFRFGNTVCEPQLKFLGPQPGAEATYDGLRTGLEHSLRIDKGGARNCAYVGENMTDPYYRFVKDDDVTVSATLPGQPPPPRGERIFTLDCVPWGQLDVSVSATGDPDDYSTGFVVYAGDLTLDPPADAINATSEQCKARSLPSPCSPADPFERVFFQDQLDKGVMLGGSISSGATRSLKAIFNSFAALEVPTNCNVLPGPRELPYFDSLFVASAQVAQVHFDVHCDPLPDITITTAIRCTPVDEPCFTDLNGYQLQLSRGGIPSARGWGGPRDTTVPQFTPSFAFQADMGDDDTLVFEHMHPHDDYEVTLDDVASSCRADSGFLDNDHGNLQRWTGSTHLGTQPDGSDAALEIQVVCDGYPPQGVGAKALSHTAVEVTWNRVSRPEVGGVAGHWVYRDGNLVSSTLVPVGQEEFPLTDTFIDHGLMANTTYTYQVAMQENASRTDGRTGAKSRPVTVTTPPPPDTTPPSTPTNLRATDVGTLHVELEWGPSSDPETGVFAYVVLRDGTEVARTSSTIFVDTGLLASTPYSYEVYALNGDLFPSDTAGPLQVMTTADTTPPSAATGLHSTNTSFDRVDLAWNEATDDESHIASYEVERDDVIVGTTSTLSYSDLTVSPSENYVYEVFAINGSGLRGAGSGGLSVSTPPGPALPLAPTTLTAQLVGTNGAQLDWTDNADNEDDYPVERSLDDGVTWTEITRLGPDATTYLDQPLAPNSVFTYRVRACNTAGCSLYTNTASVVTPEAPPPAPTTLTAQLVGTNGAQLDWTDNADNEDDYPVERSLDDGVTWTEITRLGPDATTYLDQPLLPNEGFTYRVRACNTAGCSLYTNTASVVTPDAP